MRHVSAQKPTLEKGRAAARPHPAARPYVVYIAAPVRAYDTPAYRQTVERVRAAAGPDVHVVDAALAWRSGADWRQRWPDLLRALAGAGAWMVGRIIVVPFWGGIIGAGVLAELDDALRAGVPAAVARGVALVPLGHVHLVGDGETRARACVDWSACARLCGCRRGGLGIEEARRLVEGSRQHARARALAEPAPAGPDAWRREDTEDAW